jgi:hypothetical protein
MLAVRRRGTARPRWGWSGAAPRTAAQLSASDIDLETLLPGHRSPIEQITLALRDLGGRYHRYLHQVELSPTRAERMSGLRSLLDQLDPLLSQLNGLPEPLRLRISKQLGCKPIPAERDIDIFQTHCNDEEAVRQVGEAAVGDWCTLDGAFATGDAEPMDDLRAKADRTAKALCALDTTTAAAVAIDAKLPLLEIAEGIENDLVGFAIARARIERLRWRVEQTLDGLEHQGGPERFESLRWLVWELCDLYRRETRRPVTNSAISEGKYKSEPQSPAGRFVLAAVKALQPTEAWIQEPDHRIVQRRNRILDQGACGRAVLYAMRDYVAYHSSIDARRGRWKRGRVTL